METGRNPTLSCLLTKYEREQRCGERPSLSFLCGSDWRVVQFELDYLSFAIWAKIDFVRDGLAARIAVENHVSEGGRVSEIFEER